MRPHGARCHGLVPWSLTLAATILEPGQTKVHPTFDVEAINMPISPEELSRLNVKCDFVTVARTRFATIEIGLTGLIRPVSPI
jgi:hypothetical protein